MSRQEHDTTGITFEPEFIAGFKDIFEEKIVFNHTLGLKITELQPEGVVWARLPMRNDLVGHFAYHRVHGGVISACLDTLGAMAVMAGICARHMDEPPAQRLQRFSKLGTIDLRVDYLRPGIGDYFTMRAQALRMGSRVASSRMEFFDPEGKLLSTGAGVYIVS